MSEYAISVDWQRRNTSPKEPYSEARRKESQAGVNMVDESETNSKTTTIAIKISTRERIKMNGVMGDDYDEVINRALDAFEKHQKRRVKKDGSVGV